MTAPRLAGPRVALVPTGPHRWDVRDAGTPVGCCGWRAEPDADGAVELDWSLPDDHGLRAEAVGVLLAWTCAQPGVRGVVAELAADDPDRELLAVLGAQERPGPHGGVLAVVGRVPLRGRHVC